MILQILSLHNFLLNLPLHINVPLQKRNQSVIAIESRHIFSSIQFLQLSHYLQHPILHSMFMLKQRFLCHLPIEINLAGLTPCRLGEDCEIVSLDQLLIAIIL